MTGRARKGEESPDSTGQRTRLLKAGARGQAVCMESVTEKDSRGFGFGDGERAV